MKKIGHMCKKSTTNVKRIGDFSFTYVVKNRFTFVVKNCYIFGNLFYILCRWPYRSLLIFTCVTKCFYIYVGGFIFLGIFTFDGLTHVLDI